MPPPRAALEALAAELVLDICKLVRTPKRVPQLPSRHPTNIETAREIDVSRNTVAAQSDLLALGLTCRRLLSIAQPLLYAHPVTIGDDAHRRFEFLCTTLCKYRDLALLVKSIQLPATAVNGDRRGSTDGDAALLPNLKLVHMWVASTSNDDDDDDDDDDDETTAREVLKQPAYLPFPCHALLLRGQYDKAYIDVSSGLFQDESGWLSKVQTLDLHTIDLDWIMGDLQIERLLSAVSFCTSDFPDDERRPATTLRCLTHIATGHTPWPDRDWDLSKLTAFVALEFLWLESAYFCFNPSKTALTDILPPNLVILRLSGVSLPAAALAHLRDAIVEEGKFPALARVTIDAREFDLAAEKDTAVLYSLLLLREAGIRVTALAQPLPGHEEPADEDDDRRAHNQVR
ncbi:hypothetical protein SPBR_04255 [Sporothrix brasiliensis 5110]|uniref:Uncharacterized protein n=1 Tax=Sporothrix brasiliensis 5110 TaxID=1398154 RepID=A0A0C2IWV1_9PEZI|nr:uncharacterized protein SPBR_04255 [Sporothrix brasiliensis 5110]KIH93616.1 hypothetical protein SPBR_04255 [Sporothrix brasiliensis 5110]